MMFRALAARFGVGLGMALLLATSAGAAQVVEGYGHVTAVDQPGVPPEPTLDYKVILSVTKAGPDGAPAMGLDHAARLANILDQFHVPANHRNIVVILHGPATLAVLNSVGVKAHGKSANPDAELIARLIAAGVRVDVCAQAMAGMKITRDELLPGIQVDESALTTLATLELKGYVPIFD